MCETNSSWDISYSNKAPLSILVCTLIAAIKIYKGVLFSITKLQEQNIIPFSYSFIITRHIILAYLSRGNLIPKAK